MHQWALKCANRLFNQSGTVVKRHDGDAWFRAIFQRFLRQPSLHLGNLCLHIVDDFHGITAVTCHDNAAHSLLSFLVKSATSVTRTKRNLSHILNSYGHTMAICDGSLFQIFQLFDVAEAANQIFCAVHFHCSSAYIDIRILHSQHDLYEIQAVSTHSFWVKINLIFFHITTYWSHFADPLSRT